MITSESKAEAHPDVVATTLNTGESVLLHIGTKTYFSLNETGSVIWDLISKGLTVEEISQRLESEFDVTGEKALEGDANVNETDHFAVSLRNEDNRV